jgi:hypothetical protein
MNFYEAQDFIKTLYPGKNSSFEFDEKCHRKYEVIITDGSVNISHHIECNKVKANVEGILDPIYIPIAPHRLSVFWSDIKKCINIKSDVHFTDQDLEQLSLMEEKDLEIKIQEISKSIELSPKEINEKISMFKKKIKT